MLFRSLLSKGALATIRDSEGGTLLANDPHTGFTAPALWYLARLSLQGHDIIGATIPGMPVVFLGRNADLAWGMTSSYLDDQDLMVEMQDPNDPGRYRTYDGWAPYINPISPKESTNPNYSPYPQTILGNRKAGNWAMWLQTIPNDGSLNMPTSPCP